MRDIYVVGFGMDYVVEKGLFDLICFDFGLGDGFFGCNGFEIVR